METNQGSRAVKELIVKARVSFPPDGSSCLFLLSHFWWSCHHTSFLFLQDDGSKVHGLLRRKGTIILKEKRDQVNSHTINPLKEKMVAVNKSLNQPSFSYKM